MKVKNAVEGLYEVAGCFGGTLLLILCLALVLALVFGMFCLEGWVFMLLWNWIAVEYFGAQVLGYWVCVGIIFSLNFVGKLLFGRSGSNCQD